MRLARDYAGVGITFFCPPGRVGPEDIGFCMGSFHKDLLYGVAPGDIDNYFHYAVTALYEATVLINNKLVPASQYLFSDTLLESTGDRLIDLGGFIHARECAAAPTVRLGYTNWAYEELTDAASRRSREFEASITLKDFAYLCQTEKGRIKACELWDKHVPGFVPRPACLDKDPCQDTGPPVKQQELTAPGNEKPGLVQKGTRTKNSTRKGGQRP